MTALARNSTFYTHPTGHPTRRAPGLILRGVHIYQGALCFLHDDYTATKSRLMPARSLNNANTPAQGGPLQVAGADANGGIRVIGKVPKLGYKQTISGAGALTVTMSYTELGFKVCVIVSAPAATTAQSIAVAVQSSIASTYCDITYTGTGAGVAVTSTAAAVPFVRIAGIAKNEYDNGSNASTDLAVTDIIDLDTGIVFMDIDATDPVTENDRGAMVSILDDQTIAGSQVALQLNAFLFDWQPLHAGAQGPCIRIP